MITKKKLILRNFQSPGDIVMLTAAVRDLHKCYPGEFLTDVRTPCAHLWENNPYITELDENDPGVEIVEIVDREYPLIHRSNQMPRHFLEAFIDFLNRRLKLNMVPTVFKGDIHIAEKEKHWFSQVHEILETMFHSGIIVAGGKLDYTIKWWDLRLISPRHGCSIWSWAGGCGGAQPQRGACEWCV